MKKVLLLIISVLFAIQASAQVQEESPAVTIDSLSTKLAKLQHNYNFLYCDYKLYQIKTDLNQLSQDIKITVSEFNIDIHHERYNHDLYTAYSDNYDSYCDLYDSYKRNFESLRELVTIKTITTDFTEPELNLFNSYIETIESSMEFVESNLELYDLCLKIYKDKRWRYSWE